MDYNYSTKTQQAITKEEVEECIDFYEKLIRELHILLLLLLKENVIRLKEERINEK